MSSLILSPSQVKLKSRFFYNYYSLFFKVLPHVFVFLHNMLIGPYGMYSSTTSFFSLTVIFLRLSHVEDWRKLSFIHFHCYTGFHCLTIYHELFISSTDNGHLRHFQFFGIINNATVKSSISFLVHIYNPLGKRLGNSRPHQRILSWTTCDSALAIFGWNVFVGGKKEYLIVECEVRWYRHI